MNRAERTAFLRSDEDDPDYLRDKPMGRCPWCDRRLIMQASYLGTVQTCDCCNSTNWNPWQSELDNRARYQEERVAAAKIEEKSP